MNLRQVWTEVSQKPAGRLLLFLVIGGILLAFILLRREPQPKPDNTQVGKSATQTKAYSFNEEISPPTRAQAIRVPMGQLVQTLINAEISRLSPRKIAQRFLKSVMEQIGALAGQNLDEEEDDTIPSVSLPKAE